MVSLLNLIPRVSHLLTVRIATNKHFRPNLKAATVARHHLWDESTAQDRNRDLLADRTTGPEEALFERYAL